MSITVRSRKKLWGGSGNLCAFEGCNQLLHLTTGENSGSLIGEECHIEAQSVNGPRYNAKLTDEQRDDYSNLILLCPTHHKMIDDDPDKFTVDVLKKMKTDHEKRVRQALTEKKEREKSFYFVRNADCVEPCSKYSFNSRSVDFVGRKTELQFLQDFLDEKSLCLWTCIYGNASIGKKRLVYHFFEELEQGDVWDHTCILRNINSLSKLLDDINRNTVICIEYASEHLQEIDDFISMSEDRFSSRTDVKVRIILIERAPIFNFDDETEDLYDLKTHFYKSLHLQSLSIDEIRMIASSYISNTDTDFLAFVNYDTYENNNLNTDPICVDAVIDHFRLLDPNFEKITLVFLAADQVKYDEKQISDKLSDNYGALQDWFDKEIQKIKKYHSIVPAKAIINLLVFTTMLGGGELPRILKALGRDEDVSKWEHVLDRLGYYRNGEVFPIQPGLLGEFFCFQSFTDFPEAKSLLDLILSEDIYSAASFFERLYKDFNVEEHSWGYKIKNLIIPDSLTRIPSWVFAEKKFLHTVNLGESVVEIGRGAFQSCENLNSVTIMPMLETLSVNAFRNCTQLEKVILYDNKDTSALRFIGRCCFKGCIALNKVELPETCAEIEEQVFYRCESLRQIALPRWLRAISPETFAYCFSLEGICIRSKCVEIGTSAFLNSISLKYIRGANQVRKISGTAFKGCKSLSELPSFKGVSKINFGAFEGDESLTQVDLSQTSIQNVNKRLFYRCINLSTVLLPDGVRLIDDSAFEEDTNLVTVSPISTVQRVGCKAFRGCSSLQSFDFLNTVQYLGSGAIEGCQQLSGSYRYCKPICFAGLYTDYVSTELIGMLRDIKDYKAITIPSTIKKIETETFAGLANLENVVIEDAECIGSRCFQGCINLREAVINAQKIGEGAFNECYNLERVCFGNNVKEIGDNAFAHCVSLEKMDWPAGHIIGRIGRNALSSTGIQRLPHTRNICGFFFSSFEKNEMEFLQRLESVSVITVPSTVLSFSKGAFKDLLNLREIKFEGSIIDLPEDAFSGCENLESVEVKAQFRSIGNNAFHGCKKLVSFCPNNDISKSVIGNGVFWGCESLESICLNRHTDTIPQYTFFNCRRLHLELPDDVKSVGDYAFAGCDQLNSICFTGENIGISAFRECRNLRTVDLSKSKLLEIRNDVFQEDSQLQNVFLPVSIKRIGNGSFKACRKLEKIGLPPKLQLIGIGAFQNCNTMQAIHIPDNVRTIRSHAFRGCYSLKSVSGLKGLETLCASAFYQCVSIMDINLPEGLKIIGNGVFYACKMLHSVTIPRSLEVLSEGLFERCEGLKEVRLHDRIRAIPNNFVKDCYSLIYANIPESVSSIGAGAFRNCVKLLEIQIPEGVTEISASTFFGCKSMKKIILPTTVRRIMRTSFYRCYQLKEIKIQGKISWIGAYAFAYNYEVESFPFTSIEGQIDNGGFKCCRALSEIQFGTITNIGSAVFWGCDSLKEVNVKGLGIVPGATFRKCRNLRTVRLDETVNRIFRAAFRECSELQEVNIFAKSIEIRANAFYDCTRLQTIVLPENSVVDHDSFVNCPAGRYAQR